MSAGTPWSDPDHDVLADIRAAIDGAPEQYRKMTFDTGELTYAYEPGAEGRIRELLGSGQQGYLVQRTGPAKLDPDTGETIWEPGDVVNVWPVKLAPPAPPLTRWQRVRRRVRWMFRRFRR